MLVVCIAVAARAVDPIGDKKEVNESSSTEWHRLSPVANPAAGDCPRKQLLLFGRSDSLVASLASDQCRKNRGYLELKIPFRTIDLWTHGVVLGLHVELHRQGPEFAQLSDLQA